MSPIYVPGKVTLSKTSYPDIRNGIITNGLVLNLDAAQTASYPGTGTAWTDLSGSGNNGTLVNAAYSSANNGVIQFNGTNSTTSIGTSSGLTPASITFSIWVKRTAAWPAGSCLFWAKPNGDYTGNGFYVEPLTTTANAITVTTDGANTSNITAANTSSVFALNTFVNFAFTMTPGARQIYVNGAPVTTTVAGSPTITANTATKYLMHNSPAYNNFTPGEVGQLSIYNVALTAAEVQQNFNCLRMRYGI
jgi:hypothetical protein